MNTLERERQRERERERERKRERERGNSRHISHWISLQGLVDTHTIMVMEL
jgi:hypothetical protein